MIYLGFVGQCQSHSHWFRARQLMHIYRQLATCPRSELRRPPALLIAVPNWTLCPIKKHFWVNKGSGLMLHRQTYCTVYCNSYWTYEYWTGTLKTLLEKGLDYINNHSGVVMAVNPRPGQGCSQDSSKGGLLRRAFKKVIWKEASAALTSVESVLANYSID